MTTDTKPCTCNNDECHECNGRRYGFTPPWGWTYGAWADYCEAALVRALRRRMMPPGCYAASFSAYNESFAWLVLVALLSTAAQALLSDEPLSRVVGKVRGTRSGVELPPLVVHELNPRAVQIEGTDPDGNPRKGDGTLAWKTITKVTVPSVHDEAVSIMDKVLKSWDGQ